MGKSKKRSKSIFIIEVLIVIIVSFLLLNYISISQDSGIKIQNTSTPISELNKVTSKVQGQVFNSLEKSNIDISVLNSSQSNFLSNIDNSLNKFRRVLGLRNIEAEIPNSIISTNEGAFK